MGHRQCFSDRANKVFRFAITHKIPWLIATSQFISHSVLRQKMHTRNVIDGFCRLFPSHWYVFARYTFELQSRGRACQTLYHRMLLTLICSSFSVAVSFPKLKAHFLQRKAQADWLREPQTPLIIRHWVHTIIWQQPLSKQQKAQPRQAANRKMGYDRRKNQQHRRRRKYFSPSATDTASSIINLPIFHIRLMKNIFKFACYPHSSNSFF